MLQHKNNLYVLGFRLKVLYLFYMLHFQFLILLFITRLNGFNKLIRLNSLKFDEATMLWYSKWTISSSLPSAKTFGHFSVAIAT